ncbi:MAG: glycoside hydrolase family 13 protein [Clostridia bacterium]|nr:glycoside hydrolase family 13 protein [Clostridia bacterium]
MIRINHRQSVRYIHPSDTKTLIIRLRIYLAEKEGPVKCILHYKNKDSWDSISMLPSVRTRNSKYYESEVKVQDNKTIEYYFEVNYRGKSIFLGENISNLGTENKDSVRSFKYEWFPEEFFETPSWVKNAIFYQIFPERFYNGNPHNDPLHTEEWGGEPTRENFFGGDLEGIEQKIPYLVDLGVDAIWLNPIFAADSNHKYNTYDYRTIDPHFGNEDALKSLVDKLHQNGIRIILDGVFNHTGTKFWAFQDILEKGSSSPYKDWYYIYEFPVRINPRPTYECWWDVPELPKLNVKNPEVKKYLLDTAAYWTKEFNIDGWRLDVPNEIDHDFWKEFRKVVKSINPDCYIVGEIWHDGRPWLQGDEFDAVMNYLFRDNVLDFFARRKMGPIDFESKMGILRLMYHQQVNFSLLNLLGSHDTPRVLTVFKEETPALSAPLSIDEVKKRMRPAIIFQMTYPGAPMIYYGDEIGMLGGPDPGCRRTMIWDEKEQDLELKEFYKKLIKLRKENPVLSSGSFIPLLAEDEGRIYSFARKLGNKIAVIAINAGSKEREIFIPTDELPLKKRAEFYEPLNQKTYCSKNGKIHLPSIEEHSGLILLTDHL